MGNCHLKMSNLSNKYLFILLFIFFMFLCVKCVFIKECRVEWTVDMIGNEVEADRPKENLEMFRSNHHPVVEIRAEIPEISKRHQLQKIKSHKFYRYEANQL